MRPGNGEQFIQPDGRAWSQWLTLGQTTHIRCCDCGLYHTWQFHFREIKRGRDKGKLELTARCKVNTSKTKQYRRENHEHLRHRLRRELLEEREAH
jgi:hypothetical protein